MKRFLQLIMIAAVTNSTLAAELRFYIGTYTAPGKSRGVYVSSLDTTTGKLGPVELAGETKSPSFVALSPDGHYLYACAESDGGAVVAFRVKEDGKLAELNASKTGGAGTCHVWVDATGRNVLSADYASGGVAVFQTKPDGWLTEHTMAVQFKGSGPDRSRQEQPHGHSIYTDAENKFVYSCDLGTDNVWIWELDAAKGILNATQPPSAKVPPGAGPRHLAMHPSGKYAYVNNEMGLSVTAFARDAKSGALDPFQTIATVPEGVSREGISTAEISTHPNGKWLYVSNRGHDSIAVYSIGADGRLTLVEIAPAHVKIPRGFGIDPTGRWLIAAGQSDDRIAVLAIDATTGKLTPNGESANVGSPVCILFAR